MVMKKLEFKIRDVEALGEFLLDICGIGNYKKKASKMSRASFFLSVGTVKV